MQRVKRSTAVLSLPSPPGGGTPGYFALPNPGGGIAATVPGYEWFNSVQEELCAVIAAAGITLDVANPAQLLAALRSAGVFQTQATNDASTKAATTAFANPGSSIGSSGYQKLPSGLILQWGTALTVAGSVAVTFPLTFPTACRQVFATNSAGGNATVASAAPTTSGVTINTYNAATGGANGININWLAIGN